MTSPTRWLAGVVLGVTVACQSTGSDTASDRAAVSETSTTPAEQIRNDERVYLGYYHWQVYFGSRLLPEGFGS